MSDGEGQYDLKGSDALYVANDQSRAPLQGPVPPISLGVVVKKMLNS